MSYCFSFARKWLWDQIKFFMQIRTTKPQSHCSNICQLCKRGSAKSSPKGLTHGWNSFIFASQKKILRAERCIPLEISLPHPKGNGLSWSTLSWSNVFYVLTGTFKGSHPCLLHPRWLMFPQLLCNDSLLIISAGATLVCADGEGPLEWRDWHGQDLEHLGNHSLNIIFFFVISNMIQTGQLYPMGVLCYGVSYFFLQFRCSEKTTKHLITFYHKRFAMPSHEQNIIWDSPLNNLSKAFFTGHSI